MTHVSLDPLGAVRAVTAATGACLLVQTRLARKGEGPGDGATARAVLARALGLASTGERVAALVAGPLDGASTMASAVGRRLPLVVHVQARTLPRMGRGEGAGHDDLSWLSRCGAPVFVARDAQHGADLSLAARRLAELALTPVVILHDAQPDGAGARGVDWPSPRKLHKLLGAPRDRVAAATPGQLALYGAERPRLPALVDLDRPTTSGGVLDPAADARGQVAAALWHDEPLAALVDRACADVAGVTGRPLARLSTHGMERARWVLVAAGTLVPLAEAVADELRATRRLRVGVLGLTLASPLADDQLVAQLRGRAAVAVLERTALPGDGDPPFTHSLRAALAQAVDNGRARGTSPNPRFGPLSPKDMPAVFSASCGVAGHEPSPGDLAALVQHMGQTGEARRRVVLGLDFVRDAVAVPKLQLWQEQLLDGVPDLRQRALQPVETIDLVPPNALSIVVYDTPRWTGPGAPARLVHGLARALSQELTCWPPHSPERLGQPTCLPALLATASSPLLAPPRQTGLAIVGAPRALPVEQLLSSLGPGATLLVEHSGPSDVLWPSLPRRLQRAMLTGHMVLASVCCEQTSPTHDDHGDRGDAHSAETDPAYATLAPGPTPGPAARQARREAMLLGAALKVASTALGQDRDLAQQLSRLSSGTDNGEDRSARDAVELGLQSVVIHKLGSECGPPVGELAPLPAALDHDDRPGPGHAGHFWERVGHGLLGHSAPLADPEAAAAVLPASSACLSDQAAYRGTLPALDASRCTACGECWMQCPDGSLDPRAVHVEPLLRTVYEQASAHPEQPLGPLLATVAKQLGKSLRKTPGTPVHTALTLVWEQLRDKLPGGVAPLDVLDNELAALSTSLSGLPLAQSATLFEEPEAATKGSGHLLALTVDPATCKACGVCVEVCPENAFTSVTQDEQSLARAREAQELLAALPANDPGLQGFGDVGARLSTPMAASLTGGDGACAGCGEKTALRQTLAALQQHRTPLVTAHVTQLRQLIRELNDKAGALVSGDLDLLAVARGGPPADLSPAHDQRLRELAGAAAAITHRVERYETASAGCVVGSEGCSARWGSAWPATPHTLPHTVWSADDGPAMSLGVFEGQLADRVREAGAVRRAQSLAAGQEPAADPVQWSELTDEELALCPPVLLVGGEGALGESALAQLATLLDSGRPLRVVVLDNQLAADCGGQSGAASQAFAGTASSGRRDLAWLAMAQRHAFVLQSSPAFPEHLAGGLARGFASPHPALFVLYASCPLHHELAPSRASAAAQLAVVSRDHPLLVHDPDGGSELAARLELDGNPSPGEDWVTRDGVPITPAHWAATEGRFAADFRPLGDDESGALPLHEHLHTAEAERTGQLPWVAGPGGARLVVSPELVERVTERRDFWRLLREVAGQTTPSAERAAIEKAVQDRLQADFTEQLEQQRAEHAEQLAAQQQHLPLAIARRLARGLLRSGNGQQTVAELLAQATGGPSLDDVDLSTLLPTTDDSEPADVDAAAAHDTSENGAHTLVETEESVALATEPALTSEASTEGATEATDANDEAEDEDDDDEGFVIDPSIQSIRCTTCNECTNLNGLMFAYNEKKQAYIKDPDAGTFAELVKAAEVCPVSIIKPGTPRNPDEPGLDALLQRAARFS